jgi:formylglycine-generating enzyme required for sulfatase activity
MKRLLGVSLCLCLVSGLAFGDTFGTGGNQFTVDFVNISGDAGNLGSWPAGSNYTFSGVNHGDYRMGKFEITNDQWSKFKNEYGTVYGSPTYAYDENPYFTGTNVPTNRVSWYEAAQFVNWLNTSTNHAPAYKFSGTQGTRNYTLEVWQAGDEGYSASNPYRNSNAYYFLPTEDEWVKAAYWNGTNLQTYSNASAADLISGVPDPAKWNYDPSAGSEPWAVGSGSEELNGTYDMMGNVWEWNETLVGSDYRVWRGSSYYNSDHSLESSDRVYGNPYSEGFDLGFRVASVPEPCSLVLVSLGGLVLIRRRRGCK